MSPKSTVNVCGSRTVNMRKGADDSHRCTIAFTVTVSGKILPPFVVYKGAKGGRIHTKELPNHPQGNFYTVQKKAWFDEEVMLQWVDTVLAPSAATVPIGIIPILFLDSFKVHMLGTLADASTSLECNLSLSLRDVPGLSNQSMLVLTSHTKPNTPSSTQRSL